jgi:hypothetical protein
MREEGEESRLPGVLFGTENPLFILLCNCASIFVLFRDFSVFWEVPRSSKSTKRKKKKYGEEWGLEEDLLQKARLSLHSLSPLSLSARELSEIPESMTSERQLCIRTSRVPDHSAAQVPVLA